MRILSPRISSEARRKLDECGREVSLEIRFEISVSGGSFQPVAERNSLIEILREAESRGYRPQAFNETAHSLYSPFFTSGHLRCVKPGEQYPAVISSEWVNPDGEKVVYRLYVVQPDE